MDFNQEELNAIAFEIMKQELGNDIHGQVTDKTAERIQKEYLTTPEVAQTAAQSALKRWSDIYCD